MKPRLPFAGLRTLGIAAAIGLGVALSGCSHGGAAGEGNSIDGGAGQDAAGHHGFDLQAPQNDAASGTDGSLDSHDLAPPIDAGIPITDPFDPASCPSAALSSAQALTLLGASPRLNLAAATLYRRDRTCTGMTPDTCGAWSLPVVDVQALLTYSGADLSPHFVPNSSKEP